MFTSPASSTWKSTDGGQHVHRVPRRAGRRRLPPHLDQPERSRHHPDRHRPGRDRSPSTAARPGAPGTTSRPRSSTTSAPTTRSRTACAAASRRAARRASRAAATTGRSRSATGTRSASRSTATSPPDPLDPDIVYGGKVSALRPPHRAGRRTSRRSRSARDDYRVLRTRPCSSRPLDPQTLYFAANVVWKTTDGGASWAADQPRPHARDVGRARPTSASTAADAGDSATQRGVIYTLAPSPLDVQRASGPAPTTA